jgi:hypothetical protein
MCAGGFSTVEKADEIHAFFEANRCPTTIAKSRNTGMGANNNRSQSQSTFKAEFWAACKRRHIPVVKFECLS